MNQDLIPQVKSLINRLSEWRGGMLEVTEQITRSQGCLDRHFTTTSTMIFRLEFVGIAFSGGTLMVMGKAFGRDAGYQASTDQMERLTINQDEVVFVERYGEAAERYSRLRHMIERSDAGSG